MLRWLFIAMIFANIVYFLWHAVIDSEKDGVDRNAPVPARYADAEPLVLLSEVRPNGASEAGMEAGKGACWLIGPFNGEISKKAVQAHLAGQEAEGRIERFVANPLPLFQVYIEPQEDRAAAMELLASLRKESIDSYLITGGDLQHGISLGFYSSIEAAESVQAIHDQANYTAKIRKVEKHRDALWGELSAGLEPVGQFWSDLQARFPGLEKRRNPCGSIASR
jgi:hypothetical protein